MVRGGLWKVRAQLYFSGISAHGAFLDGLKLLPFLLYLLCYYQTSPPGFFPTRAEPHWATFSGAKKVKLVEKCQTRT